MPKLASPNARLLLTFHHILSGKKKAFIRKEARELELHGICKVGYPGVLAVEGGEDSVSAYAHGIKVQFSLYTRPLCDITCSQSPLLPSSL